MSPYEQSYKEWVASCTENERSELRRRGVDQPSDDRSVVGGRLELDDPGGSAVGTLEHHQTFSEQLKSRGYGKEERDEIAELLETELRKEQVQSYAQVLNRIVAELIGSPNVRLSACGLAFATGMDAASNLGSMSAVAKNLCVTRASVSKSAQTWKELLGGYVSAHLKSDAACKVYSAAQKRNHWRTQSYTSDLKKT